MASRILEADVAKPSMQISDLTVAYVNRSIRGPELVAVRDVSIEILRSRTMGIVGESGCGKSTLIRAALGLAAPSAVIRSGSVELADGRNFLTLSPRQRRHVLGKQISFIPQNPFTALHPTLPIQRQFMDIYRAHGIRSRANEARERSLAILDNVGLRQSKAVMGMRPHQLSGGMAQRVVIAMALVLNPEILVADEPTANLDTTVQRQVLELIRSQTEERGLATLVVTHELGVVAQHCDETAVMYRGEIVEQGPVGNVLGNPHHPYTRGLLDSIPIGKARRTGIGGNAFESPAGLGCQFAPRCRYVMGKCVEHHPLLLDLARGHRVRCLLHEGTGLE